VTAPKHLSAAVVAVWNECAAELLRKRLTDAQVEAYCVCVARMRDAQGRIDSEGLLIADEKGRPIPHPALAIEKSCRAELKGLARP
jgi:P27 family predicted phage terminase small subunit